MPKPVCVVVGAGEGLGLAIARRFGEEGFAVALVSRSRAKLDALAAGLGEAGIEASAFAADVRDHAALKAALAAVETTLGPIEVLSYAPEPHTPPSDLREWMPLSMTMAALRDRMSLSCDGAVVCAQVVVPGMVARGSGTFLVTTSGSGIDPVRTLATVGMSMAAVRNYVLSLAQEVGPHGVHVANVTLMLLIERGSEHGDPDVLARAYWDVHIRRDRNDVTLAQPGDVHAIHAADMEKYGIAMPTGTQEGKTR